MAFHRGPKIVTDELVLYLDAANTKSYPGSGNVWNDISVNNFNAELINGPILENGTLSFSGTNEWVNIEGADTLVKGKSEFSMGVMVNLTSLSFLGVVIGVPRYGCTKNIVISAFENGDLRFYNDDLETCRAITLSNYLELNKWIYIVGTFDGTKTTLYGIKDGVLSSNNDTLVTGQTNNFTDYNTFSLMGRGANYLGGNLASSFVYNKALTQEEILQNYNAIKMRFGL